MTDHVTASGAAPRVAVVSGGAQGIGWAIVQALAVRGDRVVILDISEPDAVALNASGTRVSSYRCDLTDRGQVLAAADRIRDEVGAWEVVVPNVGWSPHRDFLDLSHEEVKRLIDVNLWSALHMAEAFVPDLVARRRGRVCFVSSDAGRAGSGGQSVYAAAKAGVIAFAKSLAVETGPSGVTVNAVAPGTTDTAFLRAEYDESEIAARAQSNPMRRIGTAEDVADAVAYLVDSRTSFVNGQVVSVNGGSLRI